MASFGERLSHAWNAFVYGEQPRTTYQEIGIASSYRPDMPRFHRGAERSIVASVYNRVAMDVASLDFKHIKTDENGRFSEEIKDGLNNCLTLEANLDQSARAFRQDIVMSMFDEGVVAVVPVDTSVSPIFTGSYNIETMRVGKIVEWYPNHVKVELYRDTTGRKEAIILPKKMVAIIENPLYAIMNEKNSTMQRLIRKMALLDAVDEQQGSNRLDMIIQLPYVIKSEARREQANARRKEIEDQLTKSKYGIAYTDGTEKIVQLNKTLENNLFKQVESLTELLYSQLGITKEIMNGTAKEEEMTNYYARTIEPIASAMVDEMKRKFLTKTARSQLQTIWYFKDPFKLVPVSQIADIADKFTRNEIMSTNEIRRLIGMKPSEDPSADELRNKNIAQPGMDEMDPNAMEGSEGMDEMGEMGEMDPNAMPEEEQEQNLEDMSINDLMSEDE